MPGPTPLSRQSRAALAAEHLVVGEQGGHARHDLGQALFQGRHAGRQILGHRCGQAGDQAAPLDGEHRLELLAAGHPRRSTPPGPHWARAWRRAHWPRRRRRASAASMASVLARWPRPRAKSRTWRGLVMESARPAAWRAATTGRSQPPVASQITCTGAPRVCRRADQRRATRGVVGEAGALALEVQIESGFGNIESGVVDGGRVHG